MINILLYVCATKEGREILSFENVYDYTSFHMLKCYVLY
jgi:hypothetical protein